MKLNNIITSAAVAAFSSLLTLSIAAVAVEYYITRPFQKEAVELGYAQWNITDNSSGSTDFGWIIDPTGSGLHRPNPDNMFTQIEKDLE